MTARTRLLTLVAVPLAVLAVVAVAYLTRGRAEAGDVVRVSGPMPALDAETVTGGRLTPQDYRGSVVVVNFWASWCGPCRREQPHLEAVWREYRARGVRLVGVNFRDDPAAARAYLEEFDVTYPSAVDDTGIWAHRFGVPYLPATILVDREGEMRYRLLGAHDEPTLRRYVDQLLTG